LDESVGPGSGAEELDLVGPSVVGGRGVAAGAEVVTSADATTGAAVVTGPSVVAGAGVVAGAAAGCCGAGADVAAGGVVVEAAAGCGVAEPAEGAAPSAGGHPIVTIHNNATTAGSAGRPKTERIITAISPNSNREPVWAQLRAKDALY
jgi:hypothetical protein